MRHFVSGDKHGNLKEIYDWADRMNFECNEEIGVIILGDAGILWRDDWKDAAEAIAYHESRYNFHIYFIDGNHENFNIIKTFNKFGITNISPHIHYIPRGYRLQTESGNRILCIGGADSVDRHLRTQGYDWWPDEQIIKEDIEMIDFDDDYAYVLSHCCPRTIFERYNLFLSNPNIKDPKEHPSEDMLDYILEQIWVPEKHWYFGHYHQDCELDDYFTCIFHRFYELI